MRKSSKLPAIIGGLFIIAAGIAVFMVLKGVSNDVNVMTAKSDIAAYSFVDSSDLTATPVPEASVTSDDLTESEFNDKYHGKFTIAAPVLSGQRIDVRDIPKQDNASFGAVLPDERVVAVTSTVPGAAVGTIQAGDVVDVAMDSTTGLSGTGANASSFDKVLCIASSASGCQGVLPPGVDINAPSDSSTSSVNNNPVLVLLAVPENDASGIAGQNVDLSLNPFCSVDNQGYFTSPQRDEGSKFLCQAPSDRIASNPPASDPSSRAGQG